MLPASLISLRSLILIAACRSVFLPDIFKNMQTKHKLALDALQTL